MGGIVMSQSEVDYRDVQGLVRFGYGKMKGASYSLLQVKDAAAARPLPPRSRLLSPPAVSGRSTCLRP